MKEPYYKAYKSDIRQLFQRVLNVGGILPMMRCYIIP